MKAIVTGTLLGCLCVGLVAANTARSPAQDTNVVSTLEQLEQDLGDAIVAVDAGKLNRILADDWETIGLSGQLGTKESVLANLKSGRDKLESFEIGSMDVKVYGNVAAAHGNVTEKRTRDGKDASGQFVWMDLLEKRGDRWVIVRSAGARVAEPLAACLEGRKGLVALCTQPRRSVRWRF